jgi:hypothetical protein
MQMEHKASEARKNFRDALGRLSERLAKAKSMKPGHIVFRLEGTEAGIYTVQCGYGKVQVMDSAAEVDTAPLIEVIGDGQRVRAILDGEKDATEQFFAGGFRVRGDLPYLSDIALELGLIKQPL